MYYLSNFYNYEPYYHRDYGRYGLTVVTPPAAEPLALDDVKAQLRLSGDAEDALLNSYIKAARALAEQTTGRGLITQTLEMTFDIFPFCRSIELPSPPVQSITSITYYDNSGVQQTVPTSVYFLDTSHQRAQVRLRYDQVWPDCRWQPQGVAIQFVSGYGADESSVPDGIKLWMLLNIGAWYENREDAEAPPAHARASAALLAPYRVMKV